MKLLIWNFLLLKMFAQPQPVYCITLSRQALHRELAPLSHSSTSPHPILCFSISPNLALLFPQVDSAGHQSPKALLLSPKPWIFLLEKNQGLTPVWSPPPLCLPPLPLSSFLILFQPHWPPWRSSHRPSTFLPQDLSIYYCYLDTVSAVLCLLPHFLQVSAQTSPSQRGFP